LLVAGTIDECWASQRSAVSRTASVDQYEETAKKADPV
jgi:hypothetical protein